ncbi:Efem/EfeO family lipoprotein [Bacillus sp. FJAT-29790]|uniref:iron uptake system protein EfeO n=1 Tax=Bacillus sp. FJAT-29790 TaxID=1895002 RepID=UPI001C21E3CE|nr:iron uptake system protein EfeO [Bacillus sp. FJAT-29790]MBU8878535.1 Efem/EfeO family lipoprotein [Bacillus sp. FJAT-29790]
MKLNNKRLMVALLSSSILIPSLAGCSSNTDKTTSADKSSAVTQEEGNNDIKTTAVQLKSSLKSFNEAVSNKNMESIKKVNDQLNNQWLSGESNIRETFPLLYTEIEKYILPLYSEASTDKPDLAKIKELAVSLDEALTKLENAKETEEKSTAALDKAVEQYKLYVLDETSKLVSSTQDFTNAVKDKDVQKAKELYVEARTHYERIEPIAESFGELDPKIDAREGDVDPSEWGGFHRIEKALWENEQLDSMPSVADQLYKDVLQLQEEVKDLKLRPTEVVAGSISLINEASISKITGEEERYSHVDLMDLGANVEGSFEIYNAILPALIENDKELASKLDLQFTQMTTILNSYKKNGQYVLYSELTKEQIREISQKLGVLSELMAQTAMILQ